MNRPVLTVYPGRGNTAGFALGPLFDTIIEARWHAISEGWSLYRVHGELVALTKHGIVQIMKSSSGTACCWWVHCDLVS